MRWLGTKPSNQVTSVVSVEGTSNLGDRVKAAVVERYGGPEVIKLVERENPVPSADEILVRIHRATVESADVRMRGLEVPGMMKLVMSVVLGFGKPRNPVLGMVFAGVVESVGASVTRFSVGDRVYGSGGMRNGSYKELIALPESGKVAHMPKTASFSEAVALPFGGQTSLHFFRNDAVKAGDKALVYGASGAVGVMAVQLLKLRGVHVTAVTSEKNHELVRSLGADEVLDYQSEEFIEHPERYLFIFDAVGYLSKDRKKKLLAEGGKFATVGGLEVASESAEMLQTLADLFDQGQIKAVIDKEYSFDHISDAHAYVDSKRKRGSVVLKITAE